jgi:hypothetical protein
MINSLSKHTLRLEKNLFMQSNEYICSLKAWKNLKPISCTFNSHTKKIIDFKVNSHTKKIIDFKGLFLFIFDSKNWSST